MTRGNGTLVGWIARDTLIFLLLAFVCAALNAWTVGGTGVLAAAIGTAFGFVSAYVGCYIVHEWGHLIGARASGASMPFNHYRTPLIGAFDPSAHSTRQFLALSWGGVVGYLLVAAAMLLIYLHGALNWVGAGLATGGAAFVVQSLAVDLPQINRVRRGADPVATNREGTTPAIILRRTWQTWLPLAVLIGAAKLVSAG